MIININKFKKHLIKESFFKENDYYIENAMDRYDGTYLLEEIYEFEYPENDRDEEPEHYNEFMYDYFNDRIDDVLSDIYDVFDNKQIYRMITVDDNWTVENLGKENIGIFWTYDKDLAEAHWGHNQNKKEVLINGEIINQDSIDLEETVMLNLAPGLGEEEKEIRLIKDSYILVTGIDIDGEYIEINKKYKV